MSNRMLYDSLKKSRKYNSVKPAARDLYIRLILCADDFGRFDADPVVIAAQAYPVLEKTTSRQVAPMLRAIADAGLVQLYASGGETYLSIANWNQRTRAIKSKYPPPPGDCPPDDGRTTAVCPPDDGHMAGRRPSSAHVDGDVDGDGDVDEDGDVDGDGDEDADGVGDADGRARGSADGKERHGERRHDR